MLEWVVTIAIIIGVVNAIAQWESINSAHAQVRHERERRFQRESDIDCITTEEV